MRVCDRSGNRGQCRLGPYNITLSPAVAVFNPNNDCSAAVDGPTLRTGVIPILSFTFPHLLSQSHAGADLASAPARTRPASRTASLPPELLKNVEVASGRKEEPTPSSLRSSTCILPFRLIITACPDKPVAARTPGRTAPLKPSDFRATEPACQPVYRTRGGCAVTQHRAQEGLCCQLRASPGDSGGHFLRGGDAMTVCV